MEKAKATMDDGRRTTEKAKAETQGRKDKQKVALIIVSAKESSRKDAKTAKKIGGRKGFASHCEKWSKPR